MGGHHQVVRKTQHPCQHAFDVGIQNRNPFTKTERRNGRSGRAANTRQRLQHFGRARKCPTMLRHHGTGAGIQVTGAAVVTQAAPQRQHLVNMANSQRLHVGKPRKKPGVVVQHRADLGLL